VAASVVLHAALALAAIAVATPLVWMLLVSLLPAGGAARGLGDVGAGGFTLEH
jgi:ABC-type glycerol-3-phosphate transport system permease component